MKVPYHNTNSHPEHVGGVMVQPGETRFIDEHRHPDYPGLGDRRPAAAKPEPKGSDMAELAGEKAADIKDRLTELDDDHLAELLTAEEAGKNRKGVVEAINAELLTRASDGAGGEGGENDPAAVEVEQFAASLPNMSDDELAELAETVADDEGRLALVNEEIAKRADGGEGGENGGGND